MLKKNSEVENLSKYQSNNNEIRRKKISIIIPSYNYGTFLAEAIESILHQTILPNEIIIIDDASTDNTEIIGLHYEKNYPELIKFIKNDENLGIVKTFNKAVSFSNGEYICFIGADNRVPPNYIEEVSTILDHNKDLGIAYTDFALFGSRAKEEYSRFEIEWQGEIKDSFYMINFPSFNNETKIVLENKNFIHGSSMYRREAFNAVGGYKENGGKPEDHNLFLRIIKQGWSARKAEKTILEYRQHSEDQANIKVQMKAELNYYKKTILPLLETKEKEVLELNELAHKQQGDIESLTEDIHSLKTLIDDLNQEIEKLSIKNRIKSLIGIK